MLLGVIARTPLWWVVPRKRRCHVRRRGHRQGARGVCRGRTRPRPGSMNARCEPSKNAITTTRSALEDRQIGALQGRADHVITQFVDLGTRMRVRGGDARVEAAITACSGHELIRKGAEPISTYRAGARDLVDASSDSPSSAARCAEEEVPCPAGLEGRGLELGTSGGLPRTRGTRGAGLGVGLPAAGQNLHKASVFRASSQANAERPPLLGY